MDSAETVPLAKVHVDTVLHWARMNLPIIIDYCQAEIVHEPFPEGSGDRVQLIQLLQNPISNAPKYRKP